MNTLLWFVAMLASLVITYFAWVDQVGVRWDLVGWLGIGLALFCVAATIGALGDDISAWRGRND